MFEKCNLGDYQDERGFTEIHHEIFGTTHRGLDKAIEEFDWKLDDQDVSGRTALWWAANVGDEEAIKVPIDAGANASICSLDGRTPLYQLIYCSFRRLRSSCAQSSEILSRLVQAGADPQAPETVFGETPLHLATAADNTVALSWLLDNGSCINAPDQNGDTPLNYAVQWNSHKCLEILLAHGACTSYTTTFGTLLHDASLHGDIETHDILRKRKIGGFDIDTRDSKRNTAMDYISSQLKDVSDGRLWAYVRLESSVYRRGWEEYMQHLRRQYPEVSDRIEQLMSQGYEAEEDMVDEDEDCEQVEHACDDDPEQSDESESGYETARSHESE